MQRISSPRKLTLSAILALSLWLVAVVAGVLWFRPGFWVEPGERYDRAVVLARENRTQESLTTIDRALEDDPNNAGYLIFKGHRQLEVGDNAGARSAFERALEVDRTRTDARLGLATALERLGKKDQALAALEPLSSETIAASEIHRRSQLYAALGAPQSALEDLSVLLRSYPDNPPYLKDAAELAMMTKAWDRAVPLLSRLVAATTDAQVRSWAESNRAIALEASAGEAIDRGDHVEAARRLRLLAEEKPDELRILRSQAHALRASGEMREAESIFREVLARDPGDINTRVVYTWMLNTQRRYAEAWRLVERLPMPSEDPDVLELQTRTAVWAGRPAEAAQLLRALLNRRPQDADLWKDFAEVWRKLGDERQTADALSSYVRLRSQDWRAREHLAQILSKNGSLDEAIHMYEALASERPGDADILRSLGLLHETANHLAAAADVYVQSIAASPSPKPELLLRIARVNRWLGRHEAAIERYETYLLTVNEPQLRRIAESELALSLVEAGRSTEALARVRAASEGDVLSPAELVIAARAASAIGQAADAARYLELLSEIRELDAQEGRWLASQYRASGDRARALNEYERAAAATSIPDDEVLEAIGDLRYDLGHFSVALDAFRKVAGADKVALKIARSAARAGQLAVASDAYERHVGLHPDDLPARLDAARYQASAGRPELAIAHYLAFINARGAADLRLELARVNLAAGRFDEAEAWSRQAVAAAESQDEATIALAQSLHLQGRHSEAHTTLATLSTPARLQAEADEWRGYVAMALDRHLDAFRSFERAIAAGAREASQLLLLKSTAALKRGDFGRSLQSVSAAAENGAVPATVDAARRQLRSATLPTLYVPVWSAGDSNDLFVAQGGGGVFFLLPANKGRLTLEAASGVMSQRDFSARADAFKLRMSHLFPVPELSLDLSAGVNHYDAVRNRMTWQVTGLYSLTDGTTVGVDAIRDAVLPALGRSDVRQFNRVLDLRALGPAFQSTTFRGLLEVSPLPTQQSRIEGGVERFEDGNRRSFTYLHHQVPLASSARAWTAIRPNLFFETFKGESAFYFSPRRHITAGTMLHMINRRDAWEVEWEINPQLLYTDGATGAGAHGLFNLGARIKGALLTGGAFVFWDGLEDHVQWRIGGQVSVPFAR
jgi:tetratricopeptide (TPR) repeat protein